MRRKKHKSTRRTVRFFKISFGFKEPFKVLVDGNFLHAYRLACQGQLPLNEALARLLGAPVKLFTSRCITKELREMGEDMQDTFKLTRKLCKGAECGHAQGSEAAAAECITELVGDDNKEHFFVATQDVPLRRKMAKIPAVPRIFLHANGLILEEPSEEQEGVAKKASEGHQSLGEAEKRILAEGAEEGADGERSKFRRKKAKGPNPLSMKKTNKKNAGAAVKKAQEKVATAVISEGAKAGTKRPRRKKGTGAAAATASDAPQAAAAE